MLKGKVDSVEGYLVERLKFHDPVQIGMVVASGIHIKDSKFKLLSDIVKVMGEGYYFKCEGLGKKEVLKFVPNENVPEADLLLEK